jgi:2'-5' RNA ligase
MSGGKIEAQRTMPYAISIRCDNSTGKPVRALWTALQTIDRSMNDLNYSPHISFAVYEDISEKQAIPLFDEIFFETSEIDINFSELGYFPGNPMVLWLKPLHATRLLKIHSSVHKNIKSDCSSPYCEPGVWVPHCTLAMNLPPERVEAALGIARSRFKPFRIRFDIADITIFFPVRVVHQIKLR